MKFNKVLIIFVMFSCLCINAFAHEDTTADGLLIHYDFEKENMILNDDEIYTIRDMSGNGYDAVSTETRSFNYYIEKNLINDISETGNAFSGAIKLPNAAFENINSSYTINFIGKYIWEMRPSALIDLAGNIYTTSWGSGIVRHASYLEVGERIGFLKYDASSEINMYTFICDNGKIEMYVNGVQLTRKYLDRTVSAVLSELAQNPENEFIVQNLYLDEFRLYNRALTEDEITELLNNEIILQINRAEWADNKLTANVTLNTFLQPFCEYILAAYDETDMLISTSVNKMTSQSSYVGDMQMDCGEKPAYIKLFMWDSTFGMRPQYKSLQYNIQ